MKKWIGGICAVCFVIFMMRALNSEKGAPPITDSQSALRSASDDKPQKFEKDAKVLFSESGQQQSFTAQSEFSEEFEDYGESRGLFSLEVQTIYEGYPDSALEEMAESGDSTASTILALRYGERGREDKMQETLLRAAMFGSTDALRMFGFYNLQKADPVYGESDPDVARHFMLQGLASFEFAQIRGDLIAKLLGDSMVKDLALEVTDADREAAQELGRALYEQAQQERLNRGLPEFDNSVSEAIRAAYAEAFSDGK